MGRMSEKIEGNAGSQCAGAVRANIGCADVRNGWDNFRALPKWRSDAWATPFASFMSVSRGRYGEVSDRRCKNLPGFHIACWCCWFCRARPGRQAARERDRAEFWALFCASITASAAIIYYDDGARALAASHPMVALLFAPGLQHALLSSRARYTKQD